MIKVNMGSLEPCPVCGGKNIAWGGYRYPELICKDCKFTFYPENDFATQEEYYKEWNDLYEIGIDKLIENQDKKISFVNKLYKAVNSDIETNVLEKIIQIYNETKSHYVWTKKRMTEAEKALSISAK